MSPHLEIAAITVGADGQRELEYGLYTVHDYTTWRGLGTIYLGQIFIFVEDIFFMNGPMVVKKSRLSLNIEQLRNFLVSQKCDFFLSC